MKWVLIPGLGVDHRLFANIADLLPDLQVLKFEIPFETETIEQYARRLSGQIEIDGPFVLGGTSFGGMLASIMCESFSPRCLVLMASTDNPEALRQEVRVFEWMSRLLPETLATWVRSLGNQALPYLEPLPPGQAEVFKDMVKQADLELVRRGGRMITQWRQAPRISCSKLHLHGSGDMLLPVKRVTATCIVPGAGHLVNLTHPQAVRDFIRMVQEQLQE